MWLSVLGMVSSSAVQACSGLDLPAAMAVAGERSDEIGIAMLERASAETDLALARAAFFVPSASATIVSGPVPAAHGTVADAAGGTSNRSLEGLAPFFRVDATVVQPLWTSGQLQAGQDAASQGVQAREAQASNVTAQVKLRVAQLFWAHALARRLLTLADRVEREMDEVDHRLEEALEKNAKWVSATDRYRLQTVRAEVDRRKTEATRGLLLAEVGLAATLAMETGALQLADIPLPTQSAPVPEVTALWEQAERRRPDLAALGHAIQARHDQVSAADGARWPQVFAAGTFSFAYAPNRDLQTNPWVIDPFRGVGGGVVLGLRQNFALHLLDAQADKARAELAVLERQEVALRRLAHAQVEEARVQCAQNAERLAAAEHAATAAKSWFRSAELNVGAGVEDARSLLDAYIGHVESEVNLATAQFDVAVSLEVLDQVTGAALRGERGACRAE